MVSPGCRRYRDAATLLRKDQACGWATAASDKDLWFVVRHRNIQLYGTAVTGLLGREETGRRHEAKAGAERGRDVGGERVAS